MNKNTLIRFALIIVLGVFLFNNSLLLAQNKVNSLDIKTSAVCNHCKDKIENGILKQKGVSKATLDLDNKVLTVSYNPDRITPDKLRNVISKLGYDADDVKADPKAYKKLPNCCKGESNQHKKGGCNHSK